ncbi:MFS-type transporter SLC18B1-like isoform X1 [Ptychodera flava]|uniref:MFS-type transporter SLC18B1-like isoform X1 n=1 Tax=Ptychodera flava TaxID=63121 RepID=UPI003969F4E7
MTKLDDREDTTRLMLQDSKSYQSTTKGTLDSSRKRGETHDSTPSIAEPEYDSTSLLPHRSSSEDVAIRSSKNIEDSLDKKETDSKLSISLKLLAVIIVLSRVVFEGTESMIAAFYPLEAEGRGVGTTLVGLVFSSLQISAFVTTFFVPKLIQKIPLRYVYVLGYVLFTCSTLLMSSTALLKGNAFAALSIILRATCGIGIVVCETLGMTIAMTSFPVQYRPKLIALIEVGSTIAFIIGPVIGGLLYNLGGYHLPFLVMGSLGAFNMLASIKLTQQIKGPTEVNGKQQLPSKVFICLDVLSLYGCMLIICLAISFYIPIIALHLKQGGFPEKFIGLFLAAAGLAYGIGVFVFGVVNDKFGQKGQIMNGVFAYALWLGFLSSLIMGPSPLLPFLPRSEILLCIASAALAFHNGTFPYVCVKAFGVVGARASKELSVLVPATVSSHVMQLFYIGTFFGPLISGAVNEFAGFAWAMTTSALIICSFNIFYTTYVCVRGRKNPSN